MKTKIYFLLFALVALNIASCKKDDNTTPNPSTKVDRTDTVTLGASYAYDVYYSFKNGVIAQVPRSNWDIAFSVSTRSSSILINEGSGVTLKAYPSAYTWSNSPLDTTGYKTWNFLYNADTTWEEGAFNQNATGHPNYGWGNYNSTTHNIEGCSLYIIKLRNGNFKKIYIDMKYSSLQQYSFRYSNLDGTDEHIITNTNFDISLSNANYVYYSIQDNSVVTDREPDASTWDILFTKWVDNSIIYPVTGVLQNIDIPAIDMTSDDPANITYTDDQFSTKINTIGSDWKTFNMDTYQYDLASNRYFIVKDKNNVAYKIHFTSFAGSSTGMLTFEIKEL